MNQIPNIEEGVVYEKYWFYAGEWHDAGCAFVCVDHGVCNCHTRKNAKIIKQTLHHQLQKAREETTEEIIADYMEALGTVQLPQEVWLWIADINGKYRNKSLRQNI